MTNSYNDEQNSKCLLFFGSNAAEAHPVSMLHTLHAKENGCKVIVADPRFTRTAAKADMYVRTRSGGDVAFLFGVPEEQVFAVAKTLAENRPGFIIWAMGQTQHTNANAIVRASNILMLALGNVGRSGGGCNIYRGHD